MIQIVDHKQFVLDNRPIQQFILDRLPGNYDIYFGTLDKALQRFNTVLLRLSEDPLLAEENNLEVIDCQKAIHDFYNYSLKLSHTNNWFMKIYYKTCLHGIGTRRIPKIRKLLDRLGN
jgi:hypothetical protein